MRITVFGLWHLGCVTAACLASAGNQVAGLDLDEQNVDNLKLGQPPLQEPGLPELIKAEISANRLSFTTDPAAALQNSEVLWVTIDTPVNERDEADVDFVRHRLRAISNFIPPRTLILISSQVPVGFTRTLEQEWLGKDLTFAYSPENLRLGKALEAFRQPERIIIGFRSTSDQPMLVSLFSPFCKQLVWMSVESAEMTKHALNAYLATSVTFINEIARLCEVLGADAKEVEHGLKSEGRIGVRAYLAPGCAFAGGTLARDVRYLIDFGESHHVGTPLFRGVLHSNELHTNWTHEKLNQLLNDPPNSVVSILGLTYKPGTSTLRRSASIELAEWLHLQGVHVQAHDPVIQQLPDALQTVMTLYGSAREALVGADAAVIATEWPDFRALQGDDFVQTMRRRQVIDQNWFLAGTLSRDTRISYFATGKNTNNK